LRDRHSLGLRLDFLAVLFSPAVRELKLKDECESTKDSRANFGR